MALKQILIGNKVNYWPSYEQFQKEGRIIANSGTGLILPSQVTSSQDRIKYSVWTNPATIGIKLSVPPGEAWMGAKILISSDRACVFNGSIVQGQHITQTSELGGFTPLGGVFPDGGGVMYFDLPLMYEGGYFSMAFQSPGTTAKPIEQPIIGYTIVAGTSVTMDFNFYPVNGVMPKKVLVSGDSISWAGDRIGFRDNSLDRLSGRVMFGFRVCDRLRDEGKYVRLINKGFGSQVQTEADRAFEEGWYDGIDYDLHIVNRGTNDVPSGSITGAQEISFKTSLKKVITHRNRFNPKASIIFIAPPVSDSGQNRIDNLPTIRTWIQDVANDATLGGISRKVYFYNAADAFPLNGTAANDVNFAQGTALTSGGANQPGERASGQRLHPGEYGHEKIASGLYDVIKLTDFYNKF